MKAILVNYNFTPDWLFRYPELDYLIYDRSDEDKWLADFPKERIIKTKNLGNVDYDKLSYLVDNYDALPEVFLWGKSNLFKYISEEEFVTLPKSSFTPLLTQNHKVYDPICHYDKGMYYELNTSWYLGEHPARYRNWTDWAYDFQLPDPTYIPFPPGGNFILTREKVHRYPKEFYEKMRNTMGYTQLPGEAQLAERSYYLMWK